MGVLASVPLRIFLICWILFSVFFATNVVREHYPAFALLDRGNFVCDRYAGFHADLFQHTDGHWYVGNSVLGSVIAVPPLLIFDPLLDRLEAHSRERLASTADVPPPEYDTKYPNRRAMWEKVVKAGLDLRFGASTAITSVFLMAPLSALLTVIVYVVLRRRSVAQGRAVWLAFLFAFGTPVFYRTAHLNHNMFLMEALFGAFLITWLLADEQRFLSLGQRVWVGLLLGVACALDYAGFVPAAVLFFYFLVPRAGAAGIGRALRESVPMILAGVPPLAFLLWTQWLMYGDPFTPGQFVMPQQNEFVVYGQRGMGWPEPEVFLKNLISPGFGLYVFAPLLLLALVPARWLYGSRDLILPVRERRWVAAFVLANMLFCASNWYSLLQYNTGFRYLLPVVPFAFLQASDHLARMKRGWLAALTVAVLAHGVVLSMTREVNDTEKYLRDEAVAAGVSELELPDYWKRMLTEAPVPMAYRRIASEGPQLPWLTVARQTQPRLRELLAGPLAALAVLGLAGLACAAIWIAGARADAKKVSVARLP